ncbi:DUF4350 domain-containing protein [Planctomicrobium sp. SH664]|uniref:DUF4350 domain-containing protein n=1 Tax=Planctomicrobium sp. SH664 TaxID=3448125 RepID=UPI003F5BB476
MLIARNAILTAVGVTILCLVLGVLALLRPQSANGTGFDSFGTKAYGFRGLYELLEELHIPVRREVAPPHPSELGASTLVLLGPSDELINVEPAYLSQLVTWVEAGGRLVIAVGDASFKDVRQLAFMAPKEEHDLFSVLGLDEIWIESFDPSDSLGNSVVKPNVPKPTEPPRTMSDAVRQVQDALDQLNQKQVLPAQGLQISPVKVTGLPSLTAAGIQELAIPASEVHFFEFAGDPPRGQIELVDPLGNSFPLVAEIPRGQGTIVLISDSQLMTNRYLQQGDNCVLAAHLLAPHGELVVFDEFYHGLAVRGNSLYLLTIPGFAAATLALCLLIGLWAWREAIFLGPPQPDTLVNRRDIREYVNAMARFFLRGKGSRMFLLEQVRNGVLATIAKELGLPPQTRDPQTIIHILGRRDPERAEQIESAFKAVDDELGSSRSISSPTATKLMQRMAACL